MARKASREKAAAKAQAEREQAEAVQRLGRTTWRFVAAGDEDEDCFSLARSTFADRSPRAWASSRRPLTARAGICSTTTSIVSRTSTLLM